MSGTSPQPDVGRGGSAVGSGPLPPRGRMESAEAPTQVGPAAMFPRGVIEVQAPLPLRPVTVNVPPSTTGTPGAEMGRRHLPALLIGIVGAALLVGGAVYGAMVFARPAVIITEKSGPSPSPVGTDDHRSGVVHPAIVDDGSGSIGCLQDATQTISSERRDTLLLDAIRAFADGRYDSAQSSLKEYTQEACDRASHEALRIIEQRVGIPMREQ